MVLFEFGLTNGVLGIVQTIAVRAFTGAATGALVQMRLYHLLEPLADEVGLLANEMQSLNAASGELIKQTEQKLRALISPPSIAWGVGIPAASQAFLGKYAPAVTVGRLIVIELHARRAVELAANGLH